MNFNLPKLSNMVTHNRANALEPGFPIWRPLPKERGRLAREFKTEHHADEPSALRSLAAFSESSIKKLARRQKMVYVESV